jgi:hypothetical protein
MTEGAGHVFVKSLSLYAKSTLTGSAGRAFVDRKLSFLWCLEMEECTFP